MRQVLFYFSIATVLLNYSAAIRAGEMVHQFIDPSFGGSPFNGSYVLGEASAQDQTKDPNALSVNPALNTFNPTTQSFADLIQQGLQQQLANKIIGSLIGSSTTPLVPGSYTLGNNQVTVGSDASGATVVTIVDPSGHSTQIAIPKY